MSGDEKHCIWRPESDEIHYWETQCGEAFTFNDGSPKDNAFGFCPYCSYTIIEGKGSWEAEE